MATQNKYLAVIKDARNVSIHFINFSADSLEMAETKAKNYTNPHRLYNGEIERKRIAKHPRPFRYTVGLSLNNSI